MLRQTLPRAGASLILAALIGAVALAWVSVDRAGAQTDPYAFNLCGASEVPPVPTTAVGSASIHLEEDQLTYSINATGATFTQAHLHLGASGTNGDVVAFLFGPADPGVGTVAESGTVTAGDLVGPLAGDWDGFVEAFVSGGLYVNIHSAANAGGELRAQVLPIYSAALAGANEVPPVTTTGTGNFTMTSNVTSSAFSLQASGGTEEFTQAHIHNAPAGVNGAVVAFLFGPVDPGVASITESDQFGAGDLLDVFAGDRGAFLTAVGSEQTYVNVHSETEPAGEVRGQILHTANQSITCQEVTPTPSPSPSPTVTETPEPTQTPQPTATPTATQAPPTATATQPPPTATTEAPGPPATGTGIDGGSSGGVSPLWIAMIAAALMVGGGSTFLFATQRRN